MSEEKFRRVALSMPGAEERSHMGHPDFRVNGKIFATLFWSDDEEDCGMVKLTPEQQEEFVKARPRMFTPIKGGWGRQGCTEVRLEEVDDPWLRRAVETAWRNRAPAGLDGAMSETASRGTKPRKTRPRAPRSQDGPARRPARPSARNRPTRDGG